MSNIGADFKLLYLICMIKPEIAKISQILLTPNRLPETQAGS